MSAILIVHGIANQYVGENELLAAWHPALCDGLERAGSASQPARADCHCPFYGDVFRAPGTLGLGRASFAEDLETANDDERLLLEAVWRAAAAAEPEVPGPEEYGPTLFRAPVFAERAVNALARSKFLANRLPLQFFGDLKQVTTYFSDRAVRSAIQKRVVDRITPDTKVVIGHSLGSVVAYEALCAKPEQVAAFVTLGSPLGIRNVVFDRLAPRPEDNLGAWPGRVRWTNIAAAGDIVAAQKLLAPLFGPVRDLAIDSGMDAHSATRYLNTVQAGTAIAAALA